MDSDTCINRPASQASTSGTDGGAQDSGAQPSGPPSGPQAGLQAGQQSSCTYRAPFWLPERHLQTLVPALLSRKPRVSYQRVRWATPDHDFIDLDWLARAPAADDAPLVVLFHGLEGSAQSHYSLALLHAIEQRGWHGVVPHFRSCSGEMNLAPRFYHSGDSTEIDWILRTVQAQHPRRPLLVAGVSLGGNALLRWLGEQGPRAAMVTAAVSACAPLDLHAGGQALSAGFNLVYTRNFLNTLKRKSLLKLAQFPGLFDRTAMLDARDLYQFDNIVTAPLHGYRDTDDYWSRASAKHVLQTVTVPTLVLNARNDPFIPAASLPSVKDVSAAITLEQPASGGHVGFMSGPLPGRIDWLAERILDFFATHLHGGLDHRVGHRFDHNTQTRTDTASPHHG